MADRREHLLQGEAPPLVELLISSEGAGHEDYAILLSHLYQKVLHEDPLWHYWLTGPVKLRVCSQYVEAVTCHVHDGIYNLRNGCFVQQNGTYIPAVNERKNIGCLGDDCLLLFHIASVFSVKYPKSLLWDVVAERFIHAISNHTDCAHYEEANKLSRMAIGRAYLAGELSAG